MSIFNVELKKVIDDSYEIEIGYELQILMQGLLVTLRNML